MIKALRNNFTGAKMSNMKIIVGANNRARGCEKKGGADSAIFTKRHGLWLSMRTVDRIKVTQAV